MHRTSTGGVRMIANKLTLSLVGALTLVVGCANEEVATEPERTESAERGKIIGANDLVVVQRDGDNIPAKYRSLVDAFGVISLGCTTTHTGGGLVLTAGHCFSAPPERKNNVPCRDVTVKWGVRVDKSAYLT